MEMMEKLRDTISKILEKMFFMIEEIAPEKYDKNFIFGTYVNCDFFEIELCFTSKLAKEITSNFLGIPSEPDEEDILDCLKEITNMISGNLIGRLYPDNNKRIPIPDSYLCENMRRITDGENKIVFYSRQPLNIRFKEKHE